MDVPGRERTSLVDPASRPFSLSVDGIPHQHDPRWRGSRTEPAPRPGLPLVPGPDVRQRPDHRRRVRHGRRARAGTRRQATSTPSRSTRGSPQIGRRLPPRTGLRRPAGHGPRQRRPGVPQRDDREIRPGHLRPDRLADPGQLGRQRPARVVPVHRAGVRRRPGPPRAGRRVRRSTTTTASRGWSPSSDSMLGDRLRCTTGWSGSSAASRPSSPPARRSTRSAGGPPPGDRVDAVPERRPADAAAGHRRLAVPVPADGDDRAVLPRRARVHPARSPHRRPGRGSGDGDADPPLQPALLRARHRVPAARDEEPRVASACCSGRRGSSTRWPSSRSSRASCWRSSSTRGSGRCSPRPLYAGAVRGDRRRLPAAAGRAAHRPAGAALRSWRRHRLRARLLREPRVHALVPRHRRGRHGVRVATCSGRWSAARWSTSRC